ncbi:hypothetical protein [Planctobacterium marinum]|uniref:hypothetical protein n=1 Tax=Planctobacterium marinum TaxID=1631968 RepID=UPI0030C6E3BD
MQLSFLNLIRTGAVIVPLVCAMITSYYNPSTFLLLAIPYSVFFLTLKQSDSRIVKTIACFVLALLAVISVLTVFGIASDPQASIAAGILLIIQFSVALLFLIVYWLAKIFTKKRNNKTF